jgi:hypothetical protein
VRESIEDDEDMMVTEDIGADASRVTFGKGESDRARKIAAMAAAEGAVVDGDDSNSGDDEENRRWQQQQVHGERSGEDARQIFFLCTFIYLNIKFFFTFFLQVRKGRGATMMRDEFGERKTTAGSGGGVGVGGLGAVRSMRSSAVKFRNMADVQGTLDAHLARMREQHSHDVEKLQDVSRRLESAKIALGHMEQQVCVCLCMCVCVCVYMYIYKKTYIYIYMLLHTYTQRWKERKNGTRFSRS